MGMKAVGLVSGGKDSIFAMHCARELGHNICAVATLLPRGGALETDSYMYQSVGTAMTAAIAECLGVPYFHANVTGRPILTETLNYEATAGDEVEDLHALLLHVKESIPDLQAVTCGAILSEFQRRRVEHVCQRIGLVPISLMWNRQQETLLREMINWGLHAVLVKTASMGLSRKHLGRSISELLPDFLSLNRQYDFHVCGEGGEYETLTLDCPLFEKGSIAVSTWREVCQNEDPVAPVCLLSPEQWTVHQKRHASAKVPLACSKKLHAIEHRCFYPYEELVRTAVENWNTCCNGLSNSPTSPVANEQRPEVSRDGSKKCEWSMQVHSSSTGCTLTADVSACSAHEAESERYAASPPAADGPHDLTVELREAVLRAAGQWLDDSRQHYIKDASLVQTICQVRHSGLIGVVEELFASRSVPPHPITLVVTPLPQGIMLRFRAILGYSGSSCLPAGFYWKCPADEAVLHVHSLNMWIPPCPVEEAHGEKHRLPRGNCCTCQGVRCEPISVGRASVAHIFLRGCDGRFPHSGMLPDPLCNPSLQDFAGGLEGSPATQQGLHVALQAVSSFLNMQQTLRLCQAGGGSRGLPDSSHELGSESEDPTPFRVPCPFPSCILGFVNLGNADNSGGTEAEMESGRKLEIVRQLMEGLVARSREHAASLGEKQTESQSIVIAAEVSDLPGGAKTLMLPIWEIAPRRGDMAAATTTLFPTEELQPTGGCKETVTILKRRVGAVPNPETPLFGGSTGTCSSLVCISFHQNKCADNQTSSSFLGQFSRSLARELKKHFMQKDVHAEGCHGAEDLPRKQAEGVLEIFMFYTLSCASWVRADVGSFEAECLERIRGACGEMLSTSSEIPVVTFFPVRALSRGFLEVLVCSMA